MTQWVSPHPWGYLVPLHKRKKVIGIRRKYATIYSSKQKLFCIECHKRKGITDVMLHCFVGDVKVKNFKVLQGGEVISVKTEKGIEEYKYLKRQEQNILMDEPSLKRKYVVGEKLGEGFVGEVYKIYRKTSGKTRALKIQRVNDWSIREAEILLKLQNPYVIQTYDIKEAPGTMYFVLEYMAGGDLSQYVNSRGVHLTEQEIKLIIYQVARGVQYLHDNGICHRDLQPQNILLRDRQPHTLVKVSDLGLAKSELMHSPLISKCGYVVYAAPEIRQDWTGQIYSKKIDIWSLGVLLYVGLSGTYPSWKDGKIYFLRQHWEKRNVSCLLFGMLQRMPHHRWNISEVIENEWFKDDAMIQSASKLLEENSSSTCNNTAETIAITARTSENAQRDPLPNADNSPTPKNEVRIRSTSNVLKKSTTSKSENIAGTFSSIETTTKNTQRVPLPSSDNSPTCKNEVRIRSASNVLKKSTTSKSENIAGTFSSIETITKNAQRVPLPSSDNSPTCKHEARIPMIGSKLLEEYTSSITGTISSTAMSSKHAQRKHTLCNLGNSPTVVVRTHPTETVQKRPVVLVSPLYQTQAGVSSSTSFANDAFSIHNDKFIPPSSTNCPAIVARRACETGTVQKTMTVAKSVLSARSRQSEENIRKYDTHGSEFSREDHNNDNRHGIKRSSYCSEDNSYVSSQSRVTNRVNSSVNSRWNPLESTEYIKRTPSIRQEVAPLYRNTFNHYQPFNNNWHYYNQPACNIIYSEPKESWLNFLCCIIEICFYILILFIGIVMLLVFFYAMTAPPPKKTWWH